MGLTFLFVYRGGDVPREQADQNIADLWNGWIV